MHYKTNNIQSICIIFLLTWIISPPLSYGMIYRILAVLATAIWMILEFSSKICIDAGGKIYLKKFTLYALIYLVIMISFSMVFENLSVMTAINRQINVIFFVLIGFIAGRYVYSGRKKELILFYKWIVFLVVVFSVTALIRSDRFTYVTRASGAYTDDNELIVQAALKGIGGFGFFSVSSILSPMILWNAIRAKGREKIICFVEFFLVEVAVISAGFTIALIISFVGIVYCGYFCIRNGFHRFVWIVIAIGIWVGHGVFFSWLYSFLSDLASGTMYSNKVEDIFYFLNNKTATGSFEGRLERYLMSLRSVINYPVVGSYIIKGRNVTGMHSSIIDAFGAYGAIPGFMWIYLSLVYPKKLGIYYLSEKRLIKMSMLLIALTILFNQMALQISLFCMIVPALSLYLGEENRSKAVK